MLFLKDFSIDLLEVIGHGY